MVHLVQALEPDGQIGEIREVIANELQQIGKGVIDEIVDGDGM